MTRLLKARSSRRKPSKEPRTSVLILCEGEKTEPQYLQEVKRLHKLSSVAIEGPRGVPKTLVEVAVERIKRGAGYDSIWCVFDVDQHPNLADAKQQADAHGINLAVSNPCIELWLLLHHAPYTRPCTHKQVQRAFKLHEPKYEKSIDAGSYYAAYSTARANALALVTQHERNGTLGQSPSTDFYLLVDALIG